MRLALNELARRTDESSVFRHDPVQLMVVLGPLVSRDGHDLMIECLLSVRIVERDADIELFKEHFLVEESVVTVDMLRGRLATTLSATLGTFAAAHDADAALSHRATVSQLILERANDMGFGCGLAFIPPIEATIACPSLEAKRSSDRIAQEQTDRLTRAALALQKLRQLGTAQGLAPDEQATLLQLLVKQSRIMKIHLVAGSQFLELDPSTGQTHILPMPDVGALRSVSWVDGKPWVGGQHGVATPDKIYRIDSTSERGINSFTLDSTHQRLVATHSDLGLIIWPMHSDDPPQTIPVDAAPRLLLFFDERLIFACENRIIQLDGTHQRTVHQQDGNIIALLVGVDSIWVVRENGVVEALSRSNLKPRTRLARNHALRAATLVQIEGLTALALAGDDGPVEILTTQGQPIAELHSAYQSLRMICHAGPNIVGISSDRQSALVWDISRPTAPARVIHIAARHGHRVADICCSGC